MTRLAAAILVIALALPAGAQTREETLADIRQELSVLHVEIQRLKRELSTTGAPSVETGGASVLERLDTLEAEMRRLTARTEEIEFRLDRVVTDGTRRIGDLEFRLVELEGGDVSQLGETTTLGGDDIAPPVTAVPLPAPENEGAPDEGVELAMGEQADFDAARAAYDAGDYAAAAEQFGKFTETYPGGPLTSEAHFWRGEARAALDEWSSAARAYLEAFSGAPNGPRAPEALFRLGVSLDRIGQREEACLTLGEVPTRFPGGEYAERARTEMDGMGCNS